MSSRKAYLIAYLLALVVSVAVGYKIFFLGVVLAVVFRWALNFWYATVLDLPLKTKILVSLFACAGFFYLMGYNTQIVSSWSLLKKSALLYRAHFWPAFLYISITGAVVFAISSLVPIAILFYKLNVTGFGLLMVELILLGLVLFLISVWLSVGILYLINDYLEGRQTHLLTVFKETKRFILHLVGLEALRGLIVSLPLVISMLVFVFSMPKLLLAWQTQSLYTFRTFAIVLTVLLVYSFLHLYYFSLKFYFASLELVLGGKKIVESLKSSVSLTKNKWWALNWRIMVVVFFYLLYAYIVNFLVTEIQFFIPFIPEILTAILAFVANALVTPILIISIVVLYRDLKKTV